MHSHGSKQHEPRLLLPLVEKSSLLKVGARGTAYASEKLAYPVNELQVPKRLDVIRIALGTLSSKHTWEGEYDLHHLAYEGRIYRSITDGDERIGSNYRGASQLKVIVPRQLHEYLHAIYEVPPVPEQSVMRSIGQAAMIAQNLYNTIKVDNYKDLPQLAALPYEEQERNRLYNFRRKLNAYDQDEFGILPDLEYLSVIELQEARSILRAVARSIGYSNKTKCQNTFWSSLELEMA